VCICIRLWLPERLAEIGQQETGGLFQPLPFCDSVIWDWLATEPGETSEGVKSSNKKMIEVG